MVLIVLKRKRTGKGLKKARKATKGTIFEDLI